MVDRRVVGGSGRAPSGAFQLEAFPVLGPVRYSDGWGLPRGEHGERRHEGTDILGVRGQPLRAAFDGTVSRYQLEDRGISGAAITITRADGLRANYFHVNTDDLVDGVEDAAPTSWRIPTAVQLGSQVSAGQIIGFMGDSGNAVGVPHLHFEVRTPDGAPFNPFPALREAEAARRMCASVRAMGQRRGESRCAARPGGGGAWSGRCRLAADQAAVRSWRPVRPPPWVSAGRGDPPRRPSGHFS